MNETSHAFVHERALCESTDIGSGTRIWAFAHVMEGARVGSDCNVGDGAFIEGGVVVGNGVVIKNNVLLWDGVRIEDDVFLGPNAVFTNDPLPRADPRFKITPDRFVQTQVRRGASIGANATIVCGVTIGEHAVVGAGTVVIRDVPGHALVVGNPARRVGWVCTCGERLADDLVCSCGRRYRQTTAGALVLQVDPGETPEG